MLLQDSAVELAELRFRLAPQMRGVSLREDRQRALELVHLDVASRLPDAEETERLAAERAQQAELARLERLGAVYLALGVTASPANPAQVIVTQFWVLLHELDLRDTSLGALGAEVEARQETRDVFIDDLPAGPALIIDERIERPDRTLCQARVVLPFADRLRAATLLLLAEDSSDWRYHRRLLTGIAESLTLPA